MREFSESYRLQDKFAAEIYMRSLREKYPGALIVFVGGPLHYAMFDALDADQFVRLIALTLREMDPRMTNAWELIAFRLLHRRSQSMLPMELSLLAQTYDLISKIVALNRDSNVRSARELFLRFRRTFYFG